MKMVIKKDLGVYIEELLLYSGQYALFYILMNFSKEGLGYFSYPAHVILLFALMIQIFFLTNFGGTFLNRIMGSMICPLIYTLVEVSDLNFFITNMGHFFFWVFSLMIGILNAYTLGGKGRVRNILEFIIVFMNVIIFMIVYMIFDLNLKLIESGMANTGSSSEYSSQLSIFHLGQNLSLFFSDKAHVYLALGGILLGLSLGIGRLKIQQLKEKINELFGKYIDFSIRDKLIKSGGILEEKKNMCILFCDIRNFTVLAESHDSVEIIQMLNHYFSKWDEVAAKNGGIINKFIGDAVMIIFGLNDEDHGEDQAVDCATQFLNGLDDLNLELKYKKLPEIEKVGMGIHCGELIMGNVGSEHRKEFTVIGDVVNTASRLEGITKTIRQSIIISEDVYMRLNELNKARFRSTDRVKLKGKMNPVEIYCHTGEDEML